MAVITDATLTKIKNELHKQNEKLRDFVELYAASTWDTVQLNVKTGEAPGLYPVGTEMVCQYTYNIVAYDFPWIVVAHRPVVWQDGTEHPGMILQSKFATFESIQFDAPEQIEATEETAQEGWYYCGRSGDTYTMLDLAVGATIPYANYDHVYKGDVNHRDIYRYGYNRYLKSGQRQWLNSAACNGDWWESQHNGDCPPSQLANYAGFMAGLDDDFLAVVNPIKVQVAANTVTDLGDTDIMYDLFFLPSVEEMYGLPQAAGVEGDYFPYWKTKTGLSNPDNSANAGRIITAIDNQSSAQTCRLRSASRGSAYIAWYVYATGTLSGGNANTSYRCAPACAIS